jgi:hypothetical protein
MNKDLYNKFIVLLTLRLLQINTNTLRFIVLILRLLCNTSIKVRYVSFLFVSLWDLCLHVCLFELANDYPFT